MTDDVVGTAPASVARRVPPRRSAAERSLLDEGMVASHRFGEHVGEVILEVDATSLPELFVEAGRALAELLTEEPAPATGEVRRCAITAPDREALLIAWLNELIFLSETKHEIYGEFRVERWSDQELVVDVRGAPAATLRTPVKAATFHELRILETAEGFRARLVLDV